MFITVYYDTKKTILRGLEVNIFKLHMSSRSFSKIAANCDDICGSPIAKKQNPLSVLYNLSNFLFVLEHNCSKYFTNLPDYLRTCQSQWLDV